MLEIYMERPIGFDIREKLTQILLFETLHIHY